MQDFYYDVKARANKLTKRFMNLFDTENCNLINSLHYITHTQKIKRILSTSFIWLINKSTKFTIKSISHLKPTNEKISNQESNFQQLTQLILKKSSQIFKKCLKLQTRELEAKPRVRMMNANMMESWRMENYLERVNCNAKMGLNMKDYSTRVSFMTRGFFPIKMGIFFLVIGQMANWPEKEC